MKVLIATPLYPPEIGGPATYTKLLEKQLPAQGYEVAVASFGEVRRLPKVLRHLAYFFLCARKAHGTQWIFVQDTVSAGLPAACAAMLLRKKFLVRVPGDYAWEQARQRFGVSDSIDTFQKKSYGLRVGIFRAVQQFVVRRAHAVVVPSEYFSKLVAGWGVLPKRLHVIYNGIEHTEPMKPVHPPASPYLVSAGRLVPWKGFDFLVQLLQKLPQWRLVILGEGPEKERLQKLAEKEGVADRLLLVGALPREEVLGWCTAADAFVLNTSFESFSFQIVEAMQAGAAIIATRVGSIPELIEEGKEGVLLQPNDADAFCGVIESVRTETTLWGARREAAKQKSKLFSIEATTAKVAELLRNV